MNGKRVLVVDDVISTGGSLKALDALAEQTKCTIVGQAAVLAEGDAAERKDIIFLEPLHLILHKIMRRPLCHFSAGAKREEDRLLTSGGRVLGVTATAADLKSAIEKAYERVESVHFDNAFYRHDIGQRALKALEH